MSLNEIIDTALNVALHPFLMLWYGVALHFLKKVIEARKLNAELSLKKYLVDYPYANAFAVISALVGFGALFGSDELTRVTAFGLGYMCNSIADVIGNRAVTAIK